MQAKNQSALLATAVVAMLAGAPLAGCKSENAAASGTPAMEKHACKGMNACKGQGGCHTDKNSCKGQNACKGHGGCNTDKNSCKSSNSCKSNNACKG